MVRNVIDLLMNVHIMTRVNINDIREIYDADISDASIDAHIAAASELVDDVEEAGNLTESRLATIEKYVTAHFVALQAPRLDSEEVGSHVERYERSHTYMDMAMQLDTTNRLDKDAPKEANVYVPEGR